MVGKDPLAAIWNPCRKRPEIIIFRTWRIEILHNLDVEFVSRWHGDLLAPRVIMWLQRLRARKKVSEGSLSKDGNEEIPCSIRSRLDDDQL